MRRSESIRKIKIRPALNRDGDSIKLLLESGGFPHVDVQWDNIKASWIVAEIAGNVIAAINIGFGLPIGRIEMLCINSGLSAMEKGRAASMLFNQSKVMLREMGSKIIMSLISNRMQDFQELVTKHGAASIDEGQLFIYLL